MHQTSTIDHLEGLAELNGWVLVHVGQAEVAEVTGIGPVTCVAARFEDRRTARIVVNLRIPIRSTDRVTEIVPLPAPAPEFSRADLAARVEARVHRLEERHREALDRGEYPLAARLSEELGDAAARLERLRGAMGVAS